MVCHAANGHLYSGAARASVKTRPAAAYAGRVLLSWRSQMCGQHNSGTFCCRWLCSTQVLFCRVSSGRLGAGAAREMKSPLRRRPQAGYLRCSPDRCTARTIAQLFAGFSCALPQPRCQYTAMFIFLNPEGMGIGEWLILFSENFEGMGRGMGNSKDLCAICFLESKNLPGKMAEIDF